MSVQIRPVVESFLLRSLIVHFTHDAICDYVNRRYIVVDQDNKTLFFIKKWSSCYRGDSDYNGDAIPLYSGTCMYSTYETLHKLKTKIDGLSRQIFADSFSQNY